MITTISTYLNAASLTMYLTRVLKHDTIFALMEFANGGSPAQIDHELDFSLKSLEALNRELSCGQFSRETISRIFPGDICAPTGQRVPVYDFCVGYFYDDDDPIAIGHFGECISKWFENQFGDSVEASCMYRAIRTGDMGELKSIGVRIRYESEHHPERYVEGMVNVLSGIMARKIQIEKRLDRGPARSSVLPEDDSREGVIEQNFVRYAKYSMAGVIDGLNVLLPYLMVMCGDTRMGYDSFLRTIKIPDILLAYHERAEQLIAGRDATALTVAMHECPSHYLHAALPDKYYSSVAPRFISDVRYSKVEFKFPVVSLSVTPDQLLGFLEEIFGADQLPSELRDIFGDCDSDDEEE